ncbi:Protein ApaG [Euphorbia peplus]|nr:Protein ApaG [Euphorbia peplus]
MHSLPSIKVLTDFNAGTRTCFRIRNPRFERRQHHHRIYFGISNRNRGIVACCLDSNGNNNDASSSSGSNLSGSDFTQNYALLKQQMEVAAQSQDYEAAARIRDSLKLFEDEEPVLRFRRLLKEAIVDERFEDAARFRDQLKEIAPHSLLKCSSDATTLGIRVQVRSAYIEGRSQPSNGQYFFAYRIRITNNSDRPVQLLRRHWIITDGNGKTENVWGIGVIGEQPVILPRTGFEYSSACPLSTPSGRMEGDFEMKHIDKRHGNWEPCVMDYAITKLRIVKL